MLMVPAIDPCYYLGKLIGNEIDCSGRCTIKRVAYGFKLPVVLPWVRLAMRNAPYILMALLAAMVAEIDVEVFQTRELVSATVVTMSADCADPWPVSAGELAEMHWAVPEMCRHVHVLPHQGLLLSLRLESGQIRYGAGNYMCTPYNRDYNPMFDFCYFGDRLGEPCMNELTASPTELNSPFDSELNFSRLPGRPEGFPTTRIRLNTTHFTMQVRGRKAISIGPIQGRKFGTVSLTLLAEALTAGGISARAGIAKAIEAHKRMQDRPCLRLVPSGKVYTGRNAYTLRYGYVTPLLFALLSVAWIMTRKDPTVGVSAADLLDRWRDDVTSSGHALQPHSQDMDVGIYPTPTGLHLGIGQGQTPVSRELIKGRKIS